MRLSASERSSIAENLRRMVDGDDVVEARGQLSNPPEWLGTMIGGASSATGIRVTEANALTVSAVFAAVRNIAEDVGKLPLHVYRESGTGKEKAKDHPLYALLHDRPNREMTAMDYRTALTASAVLFGNGYSEIVTSGRGDPRELWPIEPWRVQPYRDADGNLMYLVDGVQRLTPREMFHIRSFSFTGVLGFMLSQVGQDSIGIAMAAQKFAAGFFANGAHISGVLTHPKTLTEQAIERLRNQWETKHSGVYNAGRPAILQEGMKWEKIGVTPEDAQMLETRTFQVEDVARWFRIPPHKIGHLARSTFSNIEHQSIEYVSDTLMPWCVRIEQESRSKLVREPGVFVEHQLDALLRGDALSRAQSLQVQFQNGALTLDEWRSIENRNPLPDNKGTYHFVPLNMTTVDRAIADPEPPPEPTPARPADPATNPPADPSPGDSARSALMTQLLAEAFARCVRREVEVLRRAAKKPDSFRDFAKQFWNDHAAYVRANIGTAAAVAGVPADAIAAACEAYCRRSADELDHAGDVDALLDAWTHDKAAAAAAIAMQTKGNP